MMGTKIGKDTTEFFAVQCVTGNEENSLSILAKYAERNMRQLSNKVANRSAGRATLEINFGQKTKIEDNTDQIDEIIQYPKKSKLCNKI